MNKGLANRWKNVKTNLVTADKESQVEVKKPQTLNKIVNLTKEKGEFQQNFALKVFEIVRMSQYKRFKLNFINIFPKARFEDLSIKKYMLKFVTS